VGGAARARDDPATGDVRRVELLVQRVVEAGTAMKEDDRRTLSHGGSVRNEFGAVHINEQPNLTHRNQHIVTVTGDASRVGSGCVATE
jgi:hypothetical protein